MDGWFLKVKGQIMFKKMRIVTSIVAGCISVLAVAHTRSANKIKVLHLPPGAFFQIMKSQSGLASIQVPGDLFGTWTEQTGGAGSKTYHPVLDGFTDISNPQPAFQVDFGNVCFTESQRSKPWYLSATALYNYVFTAAGSAPVLIDLALCNSSELEVGFCPNRGSGYVEKTFTASGDKYEPNPVPVPSKELIQTGDC